MKIETIQKIAQDVQEQTNDWQIQLLQISNPWLQQLFYLRPI